MPLHRVEAWAEGDALNSTQESTGTLTLAFDESGSHLVERFRTSLLGAWPAHLPAPEIERVELAELRSRLEGLVARRERRAAGPGSVVLAIVGEACPSRVLYQFADMVDSASVPAILIVDGKSEDDVRSLKRSLGSVGGLLVEDAGIDPTFVAASLVTLEARQPTIERLNREIELGRVSQQTVHDELTRVHKELHEAARLQRDFTRSDIPDLKGLDLGIVFRPAGYVSGDLYEVEQLDDDHVGIFLADAVGHGMSAAMLTLFLSKSLPQVEGEGHNQRVVAPSEALSRLNDEFCSRTQTGGRFATGVYCVINTREMIARVAVAGHPPPLLIHPGGASSRLEADGPLLGVFPGAAYEEVEIPLPPNGSIVLFSDGFETAYPSAHAEGDELRLPTERYLKTLSELGRSAGDTRALQTAVAMMQAGLDQQIGSLHQADDVTAIVIAPKAGFGYGVVARAA